MLNLVTEKIEDKIVFLVVISFFLFFLSKADPGEFLGGKNEKYLNIKKLGREGGGETAHKGGGGVVD